MIKIIKGKDNSQIIWRRVTKCVWDFGLVWEEGIYSHMAGKYGRTTIEKLREDTIDISERKKFKFYNLCWYWDTQNNNTESRIGRWLGDSNRVGSALCYWFLSEK